MPWTRAAWTAYPARSMVLKLDPRGETKTHNPTILHCVVHFPGHKSSTWLPFHLFFAIAATTAATIRLCRTNISTSSHNNRLIAATNMNCNTMGRFFNVVAGWVV